MNRPRALPASAKSVPAGGQEIPVSSALRQTNRKIPIKLMVVSARGEIIQDEWVEV